MKLFDKLRSLVRRDRYKVLSNLLGIRLGPNTISGTNVTHENSLSVSAVWAAADVISSHIASIEFEVVETIANGGRRSAPLHPAYKLVYRSPNQFFTAWEFKRTAMVQALIFGRAWIAVVRDADGINPIALHLLDPKQTGHTTIDGVLLVETKWEDQTVRLLPANVIEIKSLSLDGFEPCSPVHKAREAIGLAMATEQYSASFFGNGSWVGGFVKAPNLDKTQMDQLIESLREFNAGPDNAHKLCGLPFGAEVVPNQVDNTKAQLNELRRYQILEVCRFFRIQPTKLMDYTDGTYNNFEQANTEFYNSTLLPWLTQIEQEFSAKLCYDARFSVRHNMTQSVLRGDPSILADIATKLVGGPVLTQNEGRALFGLNPVDGGDTLLQPLNMGGVVTGGIDEEPSLNSLPLPTREAPLAALPAPTPALATESQVEAASLLLQETVARCLKREGDRVTKAAQSDPASLLDWVESYYPTHEEYCRQAVAPYVALLGSLVGESLDSTSLACDLAHQGKEAVVALVKCCSPDELPGAVERLTHSWQTRASDFVRDRILKDR